jgi:5'-phosphate synthase pdxT subunit
LEECEALIIPGGESTTIRRLSGRQGLIEELRKFGQTKPIMGTCAGLIFLSKKIENSDEPTLGLIDITVRRNAYGRQIGSFTQRGRLVGLNGASEFEMVFIRAPLICRVGGGVEKRGFLGDQVVMVQNDRILGLTFHPELTSDPRIHQYFLNNFLTKRPAEAN